MATYGQVAALAGFPGQARLVGYALAALPSTASAPWHRVVNARGRISRRATPGYEAMQRTLLEAEGIAFSGDDIALAGGARFHLLRQQSDYGDERPNRSLAAYAAPAGACVPA